MTEPHRAFGYRPNTGPASPHGQAYGLFQADPYILPSGDYRQLARNTSWSGWRLFQGRAGSCWGFATVREMQLYYAVRGILAPLASPGFLYWNGRREEYAGQDPKDVPDTLDDSGTQPRHGVTALSKLGFCAMSEHPYSDAPDYIANQPPDDAYLAAYAQKGMLWGTIDAIGKERIDTLDDMLKRGLTSEFGMMVDGAYMRWQGPEPVSEINLLDIKGGHMLTPVFVDYPNQCVWTDGWWDQWGPFDGFGKISFEVFGNPLLVKDLIVTKYLPTLMKKA